MQVFSCKFCEISKNTFAYGTSTLVVSAHVLLKARTFKLDEGTTESV